MAIVQTNLANTIDASEGKAKLDEYAKSLIRHKAVLARILKECVDEFKDFDVEFIQNECIVDEIQVSVVALDQDVLNGDAKIIGANTEDASYSEGTVRFDVLFTAKVPNTEEVIGLTINVEIQGDVNPGYPIIARAVYYVGRLISRQKGTVFQNSDYGKLQKVYSIWICPDPTHQKRNSYAEYGMKRIAEAGYIDENEARECDRMRIIIVSLNDEGTEFRSDLIRFLSYLLSTKPVKDRKSVLENDYRLPMTKEIEEEMEGMCNYGEAIAKYNRAEGMRIAREQAEIKARIDKVKIRLDDIKNAMDAFHTTAQEAMTAFKIPVEEQDRYMTLLAREEASQGITDEDIVEVFGIEMPDASQEPAGGE